MKTTRQIWRVVPVRGRKSAGKVVRKGVGARVAAARPAAAAAQRVLSTTCRRSASWPISASGNGRSRSTRRLRLCGRSFQLSHRTNSARSRHWNSPRATSTFCTKFYRVMSWTRGGPAAATWRTSAWVTRSLSGEWGARGPCPLHPTNWIILLEKWQQGKHRCDNNTRAFYAPSKTPFVLVAAPGWCPYHFLFYVPQDPQSK